MSHPDSQPSRPTSTTRTPVSSGCATSSARAATATDQEVAALALEAWSARRLATFEDAERGLLFGRLDFEEVERPLYVGRRWVHDDDREQVVVNWQAPAARPFYTATPVDPQRVTLRRRFRTQGRRLLDIADEALDGTTLDGASVGDFLLEELERSRESHMRDIVATIQADQYRLITRDPDRPLVIQGGPGTGKTAVGLHRASWLLYTFRERLSRARVLVVGPNRTFMEYVSHVLPALGENAVEQRAVSELVDGVEVTLQDPPEVARLKADPASRRSCGAPPSCGSRANRARCCSALEGEYVRVRAREARELLAEVHEEHGTTAAARERFRMGLVRRFYAAYGQTLGGAAFRDGEEIEKAMRAGGYLNRVLERAWPAVSPEKLVRALYTTPAFLAEAADGLLTAEEQRLLRRRGAGWSDGDVPLLDEAHALVGEPAADVRSRDRRRGPGSDADAAPDGRATRAGRRAHGARRRRTGHRGGRLRELAGRRCRHLPRGDEAEVEELRHAYRVPREIMELALPLLDADRAATSSGRSRTGPAPPPRPSGRCRPTSSCGRHTARPRAGRARRVSSR